MKSAILEYRHVGIPKKRTWKKKLKKSRTRKREKKNEVRNFGIQKSGLGKKKLKKSRTPKLGKKFKFAILQSRTACQ
jgi:hypothetical protein